MTHGYNEFHTWTKNDLEELEGELEDYDDITVAWGETDEGLEYLTAKTRPDRVEAVFTPRVAEVEVYQGVRDDELMDRPRRYESQAKLLEFVTENYELPEHPEELFDEDAGRIRTRE